MSEETDLKKRIEALERQVGMLEDVHAIRRLHHLYGYFLDKCMYDEVVDCYADDCEFYFFGGHSSRVLRRLQAPFHRR